MSDDTNLLIALGRCTIENSEFSNSLGKRANGSSSTPTWGAGVLGPVKSDHIESDTSTFNSFDVGTRIHTSHSSIGGITRARLPYEPTVARRWSRVLFMRWWGRVHGREAIHDASGFSMDVFCASVLGGRGFPVWWVEEAVVAYVVRASTA